MEGAIGKAQLRKATPATLSNRLPQVLRRDHRRFSALKKVWVPDSGSWMSFDGQKDHDWTIPGAAGDADIEAKEDSKATLNAKSGRLAQLGCDRFRARYSDRKKRRITGCC